MRAVLSCCLCSLAATVCVACAFYFSLCSCHDNFQSVSCEEGACMLVMWSFVYFSEVALTHADGPRGALGQAPVGHP